MIIPEDLTLDQINDMIRSIIKKIARNEHKQIDINDLFQLQKMRIEKLKGNDQ